MEPDNLVPKSERSAWLEAVRLRELGSNPARNTSHVLSPRAFQRHLGADPSLVSRLSLSRVLKGHAGCVNTVSWNETGELLVSGSDDTALCVWDYHNNGFLRHFFATGHTANIFCARFVPQTDSRRVVSCAGDSSIRVFDLENTPPLPPPGLQAAHFRTNAARHKPFRVYDVHEARTKKIAFDSSRPDSVFFSASEDGTVRMFDLREPYSASSSSADYGVVVDLRKAPNEVELYSVSVSGPLLAAAGADPLVRVYDLRTLQDGRRAKKHAPVKHLGAPHLVRAASGQQHPFLGSSRGHITGISFRGKEMVASYIGDAIYLFNVDDNLDAKSAKPIMSGLGPAGIRELNEKKQLKKEKKASKQNSSSKRSKPANRSSPASSSARDESSMDVDTQEGDNDDVDDQDVDFPPQIDEGIFYSRKYTGHSSIRTIKECSFFGPQQEYIVSGSDCGHIFIWDKESARIVTAVKGDSSIVNSVQGHPLDGFVLASSGIESDAKIWRPGDRPAKPIDIDSLVKRNNASISDSEQSSSGIPLSVIRHILRNLRAAENSSEDSVDIDQLLREVQGVDSDAGDDDDDDDDNVVDDDDDDEGDDMQIDSGEVDDEEDDDSDRTSRSEGRRRRRGEQGCRQS